MGGERTGRKEEGGDEQEEEEEGGGGGGVRGRDHRELPRKC